MMKDEIMQIVGENLFRFRTERGYTQEKLAELAGISTSFYANLERGKKGVSIFVLRDLAEILGVSTDSILYPAHNKARLCNIESMLSDVPDEFISSVEKLIRLFKEEFFDNSDSDI